MATVGELFKKLNKIEEAVTKAASRPAGAPTGTVFGGRGDTPFSPHGQADWPVERLKRLSSIYNGSEAAIEMYGMRHGRPRVTGMGPALIKAAAVNGHPDVRAIAKSYGMSEDYGPDSLEAEYGFTTIEKAKRVGVPGYDRATGKVLMNERRKSPLAEGSGFTGGYVVPPQYMNELLTIAGEEGFVEQRAKVIPMNTRTATWPMLDITTAQAAGVSPYFGGITAAWQPEGSSIAETEPGFRQSEWTAWDLVLYTVSSNQLLADNGIALDALLTQLFGQAITWYKEYAYLRGLGAGSSMPLGVLNAPATILQQRVAPNAFRLADAAAMMSHLHVRSWDDAVWIMHQSVLPQLIQMVNNTSSNQLVWMTNYGDGKTGAAAMKMPEVFFNGLPVFFTEKLPSLGTTGDVMLVDWSRYVIGMRLDMQIDVSPHFLFRNNQLAWRVIARADGKPWLNAVITDASGWTISPFICLQ